MRLPSLALLILAVPAHAACGPAGPAYEAHPATAGQRIRYRLTFTDLPPGAPGSAIFTRWHFTLLSRRTGRRLSELVLFHTCGMGRAPCIVFASPDSSDDREYLKSEVVELNRDFSPVRYGQEAHALLFPQFGQRDWTTVLAAHDPPVAGDDDIAYPEIRYHTRHHVQPDLSDQIVWLRAGCAPAPVRRRPRFHTAPHRLHERP